MMTPNACHSLAVHVVVVTANSRRISAVFSLRWDPILWLTCTETKGSMLGDLDIKLRATASEKEHDLRLTHRTLLQPGNESNMITTRLLLY